MKSSTNITGQLFSPCFMTEQEFENGYKESTFYVDKDFLQAYRNHMVAMEHIASIAKSYVFNNWQKVTDWSNLDIEISDGAKGGAITEYFNADNKPGRDYSDPNIKKSKTWVKLMESIEEHNRERHNPIVSFDDVVLDPTDGDFSVTINGKEHWWISDDIVIAIADYIEKQLKTKES